MSTIYTDWSDVEAHSGIPTGELAELRAVLDDKAGRARFLRAEREDAEATSRLRAARSAPAVAEVERARARHGSGHWSGRTPEAPAPAVWDPQAEYLLDGSAP